MHAASADDNRIIRILLENGALVDIKNLKGEAAVSLAKNKDVHHTLKNLEMRNTNKK